MTLLHAICWWFCCCGCCGCCCCCCGCCCACMMTTTIKKWCVNDENQCKTMITCRRSCRKSNNKIGDIAVNRVQREFFTFRRIETKNSYARHLHRYTLARSFNVRHHGFPSNLLNQGFMHNMQITWNEMIQLSITLSLKDGFLFFLRSFYRDSWVLHERRPVRLLWKA